MTCFISEIYGKCGVCLCLGLCLYDAFEVTEVIGMGSKPTPSTNVRGSANSSWMKNHSGQS